MSKQWNGWWYDGLFWDVCISVSREVSDVVPQLSAQTGSLAGARHPSTCIAEQNLLPPPQLGANKHSETRNPWNLGLYSSGSPATTSLAPCLSSVAMVRSWHWALSFISVPSTGLSVFCLFVFWSAKSASSGSYVMTYLMLFLIIFW